MTATEAYRIACNFIDRAYGANMFQIEARIGYCEEVTNEGGFHTIREFTILLSDELKVDGINAGEVRDYILDLNERECSDIWLRMLASDV
jgi:hypothetical protein